MKKTICVILMLSILCSLFLFVVPVSASSTLSESGYSPSPSQTITISGISTQGYQYFKLVYRAYNGSASFGVSSSTGSISSAYFTASNGEQTAYFSSSGDAGSITISIYNSGAYNVSYSLYGSSYPF